MKMNRILAALLALVMVLAFAACGKTETPPAGNDEPQKPAEAVKLSMATGSVGGSVYTTCSGWANVMNNVLAGKIEITCEQTNGSVANVPLVESGDCELGMGAVDVLYNAYNGQGQFSQKFVKPLAIAPCDNPVLTPFSLKGSGIETLSDLDGKVVALGPKGSSIDSMFRAIFAELGIEPKDILNDTWGASITAMKDGIVDAIITQSTPPWPSLAELEATHEASLIQMTKEEMDVVVKLNPWYSAGVIKAGAYKANPDFDVQSLGLWAVFYASADMDEQLVYDLCEATFASHDDLSLVNNALKVTCLAENAPKVGVQFHPGAEKWYADNGIKLPAPAAGFAPQA